MFKWLFISATVIAIDQVTKIAARAMLQTEVAVLPFFNLRLAFNRGAAFSFLSDAGGWQRWFFTALAVLVSIVILVWLKRLDGQEKWTAAGLSLVLGGAIGNVIDRIAFGYVTDFLDVFYQGWHWPTFNVADAAISVGAAILVVHSLFFAKAQQHQ